MELQPDLNRKPTPYGTPSQFIQIAMEIYAGRNHPVVFNALLAVGVLLGIPLLLGLIIILFGWHKPQQKQAQAAFSMVPIVGVALQFTIDPIRYLSKLRRSFQSYFFCVDICRTEFTVLCGAEGLEAVSHSNKEAEGLRLDFYRGVGIMYPAMFPSKIGFMKDSLRSALEAAASRSFGSAASVVRECIGLEELVGNVKQHEPWDLFQMCSLVSAKILAKIAFGDSCFDEHETELVSIVQKIDKTSMSFLYLSLKSWSPFSSVFSQSLHRVSSIIKTRLTDDKSNQGDHLVSRLIALNQKMSNEEIAAHVLVFFLVHQSTLANMTAWSIYHALKDEDLKKRVDTEIAQANLPSKKYDGLKPLKVLPSLLLEVDRMYPPILTIYGSKKKQPIEADSEVNVFFNDLVCSSPALLAFDERVFKAPNEFDVSRFIDSQSVFKKLASSHQFESNFAIASYGWLEQQFIRDLILCVLLPEFLGTPGLTLLDSSVPPKRKYFKSYHTPTSDTAVWMSIN